MNAGSGDPNRPKQGVKRDRIEDSQEFEEDMR